MTWLYTIPPVAAILAAAVPVLRWERKRLAAVRALISISRSGQDRALARDGQPWPGLDARSERIVPRPRPVLAADEAELLLALYDDAHGQPHTAFVAAMADQVAGFFSARFPGASADEITRMLLVAYLAQRKIITAGGTSGDVADATGHAAVVLAHRPDVPEWSTK